MRWRRFTDVPVVESMKKQVKCGSFFIELGGRKVGGIKERLEKLG